MLIEYTDHDLAELNAELEFSDTSHIVTWAWRTFGPDVAASSSFQTQSLPLLHLIATHVPAMPVLFLDTGFHFPETLAFRDQLVRELGLNVVSLTPAMGHDGFRDTYGLLYREDPDRCCYLNKVEPLAEAKTRLKAWVTGIRRDQTSTRKLAMPVEREPAGNFKISPMLRWTEQDVADYITRHHLPEHPLSAAGYTSIGCAPCTRAVKAGENSRAGSHGSLTSLTSPMPSTLHRRAATAGAPAD